MEKKQISIEPIIRTDGIKIAIIVETMINWHSNKHGALFIGRKQPLYVSVIEDKQKRILRLTGEELSYKELVQECSQARSEYDKLI